jgi:mannosyltransferase
MRPLRKAKPDEPSLPESSIPSLILGAVVFFVAMALRIPSSRESFWVDELHTSWCITDGLAEVTPRASIGNQSPVYFWGMWFWKQLADGVGMADNESALRMSSMLATSLAAALLAWTMVRYTRSLAAGLTSGLVLATEINAIFYGTELRPYAWVLLMMTATLASIVRPVHSKFSTWTLLLLGSIATWLQPTAAVSFAMVAVGYGISRLWVNNQSSDLQIRSPRYRWKLLGLITLALSIGLLCRYILTDAWQHRSNWSTFAKASAWQDVWNLWPWIPLLVVPLVIFLGTKLFTNDEPAASQFDRWFGIILIIAVTITAGLWLASKTDIVHLWHRRYMISVLPMFALLVGFAIHRLRYSGRFGGALAWIGCITIVGGLMYWQQTLQTLAKGSPVLVSRCEDWKSAIAWVNQVSSDRNIVLMDSGLIESRMYLSASSPQLPMPITNYLTYPARGCYRIDKPMTPIYRAFSEQFLAQDSSSEERLVLARYPARVFPESHLPKGTRVFSFGGVTGLLIPANSR